MNFAKRLLDSIKNENCVITINENKKDKICIFIWEVGIGGRVNFYHAFYMKNK